MPPSWAPPLRSLRSRWLELLIRCAAHRYLLRPSVRRQHVALCVESGRWAVPFGAQSLHFRRAYLPRGLRCCFQQPEFPSVPARGHSFSIWGVRLSSPWAHRQRPHFCFLRWPFRALQHDVVAHVPCVLRRLCFCGLCARCCLLLRLRLAFHRALSCFCARCFCLLDFLFGGRLVCRCAVLRFSICDCVRYAHCLCGRGRLRFVPWRFPLRSRLSWGL